MINNQRPQFFAARRISRIFTRNRRISNFFAENIPLHRKRQIFVAFLDIFEHFTILKQYRKCGSLTCDCYVYTVSANMANQSNIASKKRKTASKAISRGFFCGQWNNFFNSKKIPQLIVQWNKYVKSMKDLNLKQNGPVEIFEFWEDMNEYMPDLARFALDL